MAIGHDVNVNVYAFITYILNCEIVYSALFSPYTDVNERFNVPAYIQVVIRNYLHEHA